MKGIFDKNSLITVLKDWNFWDQELACGMKRKGYLARIKPLLSTGQILVITGPRRAGKSYLMRQMARELIDSGLPPAQILMVNFEDPRLGPLNTAALEQIFEVYLEFKNPSGRPYLFFDEIQEVDEWEKWVRMMHEREKAVFVISGSNARLLSRELSTLLTGRHVGVTVFPLSFREMALFKGLPDIAEQELPFRRIELSRLLPDYLEWGSFPAVVQAEAKKELLLQYFDDVLRKDLIRRYKVRKGEELISLAKFYMTNQGSLVTFNSAEKFLKISADTIEKFSSFFEEAYLFFFNARFSFKMKERLKSPRKVYAVDTGLANTIGFRSAPNRGRLAETLVFLKLARIRSENPEYEIFYWKDHLHREVDFVVKAGPRIENLIQVCWDLSSFETKKREVTALLRAMQELKVPEGLILTESDEGEEKTDAGLIRYQPLWKWLCGNP